MATPQTSPEPTDEGTSRYVRTRSWKIHYNEAGEGTPLILLHGSGAGATGWSNFRPNIGPLSERFRVLAVDAPGWGRSDAATPDVYDHPNAVLEFMDALEIEKAALVGNSMGGMTAVTFAARHPDRISHLITMGPGSFFSVPPLFSPGDGPSEGLKVLAEGYRNPTPETMKRLVEIMTFAPEFATDELARIRADAAAARPDHLANWITGMAGGGPVRTVATPEQITSIRTPALLIHGRDDRVVHFEHSLRLVSMIRNSRLVLLNRCGHWAQIEHAAEFNRLVADFVRNA
ncbi:alpha/beta fold hydrolase [Geodermatophilus sp. CPCC 205761]|uniref:alpha/beta fold hydrolase n=1 Tax=Geodermatophilus sp. CPCC 205761 TaxID=2936597 RepID=UPI003EE97540